MKKNSESKENLVKSNSSEIDQTDEEASIGKDGVGPAESDEYVLTQVEKRFLLSAERGDCATVRRLLAESKEKPEELNINCVDPLNRSALIAAIENENIELIRILLEGGIKVNDGLLHAISEEYVEAVETLLQWEEEHHQPGQPYSWEAVDRSSSNFTPDITPLILAAHRNNYEILKILLDRGATLPMPHDVRCGCDECVTSSEQDSLRHSQSRINAYRALSSSSLIALSSRDPILTAFELSWELRRLSRMETEFRQEYNEMRKNVQEFSTALLDHARTSHELEVMLNFNPTFGADSWDPGERQTLERLKLAIKYQQKMFVAHPNVQQLLAAIWYEGLPGFRRKSMTGQMVQVAKLGAMFPIYSTIYMLAPNSEMGKFMKKPFVKFICHSASYAFFLMLLGAASQRIEYLALEFIGTPWMLEILEDWKRHERGALPGPIEFSIIFYIISLIYGEIKSLWNDGLLEYVSDLWNIVDFISNSFYVTWMSLRFTAWFTVQRESWNGLDPWYPREQWHPFDPMLLSEGAFAAGMIFSFLKLVHIFSINPHLGPLQVSLGRMIIDIIKFFFIYTLVLFAFGCGLNQLLWYYADLEKNKCYHLPNDIPDFDNNEKACAIWRRFTNLFETSQSLFWASFGLVDLMAFDLQGIKSFTRFWALLMFGSYSVINIIVLLNMLIAMMSNSYQIISERSDVEWKFARSQLWMSYFEDGDTVPPPFNLFPSIKLLQSLGGKKKRTTRSMRKSQEISQRRHDNIMRLLVRRFVTAEQRKRDDFGITEDDVMEIRQDISTLRYELIDILNQNGMKTPTLDKNESSIAGKKGKMMERRILKDFQIGFVENIINEAVAGNEVKDVFSSIAKALGKKTATKSVKKQDWNAIVRKNTVARDPIGSTRTSLHRRSRRSLRKHILETANQGLKMDTDKLLELNPKLSEVTPTTRVAYVKFMARAINKTGTDDDDTVTDENEKSPGGKTAATTATLTAASSSVAKANFRASVKKIMKDQKTSPNNVEDCLNKQSDAASDSSQPKEPQSKEGSDDSKAGVNKTSVAQIDEKRIPTPIPEEPSDDTPKPADSDTKDPETKKSLRRSTKGPSPQPPTDAVKEPTDTKDTMPIITISSDSKDNEESQPSEENKRKPSIPKDKKVSIAAPPPVARPAAPINNDRGKSKLTGKTISGWI